MRKFFCTPVDLEKLEERVNNLLVTPYYAKLGKIGLLREQVRISTYILSYYGLEQDEATKAACTEFYRDQSVHNYHMVAHHCIYQLYYGYMCRKLKHQPAELDVRLWKKVTEDCYDTSHT